MRNSPAKRRAVVFLEIPRDFPRENRLHYYLPVSATGDNDAAATGDARAHCLIHSQNVYCRLRKTSIISVATKRASEPIMQQSFKHSLLFFAALLTVMSTVYLASLLYLPQQLHLVILLLMVGALAIVELHSLRVYAANRSVPAFRHKPGRLWLVWLSFLTLALLAGAGLSGIQILIAYDAGETVNYQKQINSGLMLSCIMLLSNYVVRGFTGSTKAIQPEK